MAKNKKQIEYKDPKTCIHHKGGHCIIKMKSENKPTDYSRVEKCDCVWYKCYENTHEVKLKAKIS